MSKDPNKTINNNQKINNNQQNNNNRINNNQKRLFHIDSDTSTDQGFTLLDAVQSDNEDEIDKLMNDFDTKFRAPEEIELTDNPDNTSSFKLEVNVHVVD